MIDHTMVIVWIGVPLLSLLLGFIEIQFQMDNKRGRFMAHMNWHFFLYFLILTIGNFFTTFVTAAVLAKVELPGPDTFRPGWYLSVGVFGFQAVLQNMSITFFDTSFGLIQNWTRKAKQVALSGILGKEARLARIQAVRVAGQIRNSRDLNAIVAQSLGRGSVVRLNKMAKKDHSPPPYFKALALAFQKPENAEALLKQVQEQEARRRARPR